MFSSERLTADYDDDGDGEGWYRVVKTNKNIFTQKNYG